MGESHKPFCDNISLGGVSFSSPELKNIIFISGHGQGEATT
jgi:hypothetical protein